MPLLLLHAWVDSSRVFDRVMAGLPERIHAFAFDQRGHGGAAKPAGGYVREVVTETGFTRFRRATETPLNLVLEARP